MISIGRTDLRPSLLWYYGIFDELYFFSAKRVILLGKKSTALFHTHKKPSVFNTLVRVFAQIYANMRQGRQICALPSPGVNRVNSISFLLLFLAPPLAPCLVMTAPHPQPEALPTNWQTAFWGFCLLGFFSLREIQQTKIKGWQGLAKTTEKVHFPSETRQRERQFFTKATQMSSGAVSSARRSSSEPTSGSGRSSWPMPFWRLNQKTKIKKKTHLDRHSDIRPLQWWRVDLNSY